MSFLINIMGLPSRILLRVKMHVLSQCWTTFHHVRASAAVLLNKAYWLIFKQVCGLSFCRTLCYLVFWDGLRKPLALHCFKDHKRVWVDRYETTSAFSNFLCIVSLQKDQRNQGPFALPSLKITVITGSGTISVGNTRVECLSRSYSRNNDALSQRYVQWMLCVYVCA